MENDYDIPLDDYGTPYVTIEEMQDLLKARLKPYEQLQYDKQTKSYYTKYGAWNGDLLQQHLLMEQCIEHLDEMDWLRTTNGYDITLCLQLQHLWENPLVWLEEIPSELQNQFVISGRVAVEKSSAERNTCPPYTKLSAEFDSQRILWFVDQSPTKDLIPGYGYYDIPDDMLLWNILLTSPDEYFRAQLHAPDKIDSFTGQPYWVCCNADQLLFAINEIALFRSHQRAAQIVRLLREDWPDIKAMKLFGVDKLTPEQLSEFEQCLFAGMDRNLRKWDAETQEEQTVEPIKCRYIDLDKLAEVGIHTPEEFTQSLRQACEQDAPTLGAFLKKNFKLGYLDFHGDGKKKIYEHLKECFPQGLHYSYPNFTLYFD